MKAGCAAQKLQFEAHGKRDVVADFDGGRMTSDGGGLLLREANCCLGDLMAWLGQCVSDFRQQGSVEHTATDLIAQHEDLNDHGPRGATACWPCWRAARISPGRAASGSAGGDLAGPGRDRRPDARPAGRPFLSWLLPGALAGDPDPHPRGRGVLPRRDPELVRSQCGGLRARAGSALTPRHAPCPAVLLADRRGGAPLPPVPLSHAQLVEPQAARDRQGRAPAAGRQSALRGDQPGTLRNPVAAAAIRAGLLRPRRDGEPHQGAAAVSVRRPHQQRDDAR